MESEIKEMGKFACINCEYCGTDEEGGFRCGAGVNQDVCGLCQDLGEALYNAGYHKTEFKTNSDKLRNTSDEELAKTCITSHWDYYNDSGMLYQSTLVEGTYTTFDGAYKANLKWLKQKYKGE